MKIPLTPFTLLFLLITALTPLTLKGMEVNFPNGEKRIGDTSGGRGSANYEIQQRRLTGDGDDSSSNDLRRDSSDASATSQLPMEAQSTPAVSGKDASESAIEASVILVQHQLPGTVKGVPQKIADLQQRIETTKAPILELKNEAWKNRATRYLAASTQEERQQCLQELGTGPKAEKLKERLIYIQNFKSAVMLLNTAKEHAENVNAVIEKSQERPAELAVYLSGLSNVEERVNLLQQHADNIVELNRNIVAWRKSLAEETAENNVYRKRVLSEMLKTAQQSIDDASLFGEKAIDNVKSAREHRLAAEASSREISPFQGLLELSPTQGVNGIPQRGEISQFYEGIPVCWHSSESEEYKKYKNNMHTISLLGYAVLFRRRAAKFEMESPELAPPCKEAAFAYSEAARYGMSFVENQVNDPSLAQRHRALADAYSELARCRKARVGDSISVIAPNAEESGALEKVNQLLREEENFAASSLTGATLPSTTEMSSATSSTSASSNAANAAADDDDDDLDNMGMNPACSIM